MRYAALQQKFIILKMNQPKTINSVVDIIKVKIASLQTGGQL
jgi:hypothetical protein